MWFGTSVQQLITKKKNTNQITHPDSFKLILRKKFTSYTLQMSARLPHNIGHCPPECILYRSFCPGLLKTIGHLGFVIGQCPRFNNIGTPPGLSKVAKSHRPKKPVTFQTYRLFSIFTGSDGDLLKCSLKPPFLFEKSPDFGHFVLRRL